jgi:uncharacterized protein
MVQQQVHDYVKNLAREFSPERVILFGSHARGEATDDSDVDLLVIMPTAERSLQQALEIRRRIPCRFPLDLLVKTPQEVAERMELHDAFLAGIFSEGVTLYESPCA